MSVQNRDRLHTQDESAHPGPVETVEQEAVEDYAAVRVHVTNPVDVSPAAQFGTYETIVLAGSGNQQILPHDPLRQFAYIMSVDAPIVIRSEEHTSELQS